MIHYVCGFMIHPQKYEVLLLQKNRPEFQKGKWNGIGGKIETGESALGAMVREFYEETGVQTYDHTWELAVSLTAHDHTVDFFRAVVAEWPGYRTTTDERVAVMPIESIFNTYTTEDDKKIRALPTLDNMRWIFSLCLSGLDGSSPIQLPLKVTLGYTH